jgi:hypothetical protein
MTMAAPAKATSIADAERLIHERYPNLEFVYKGIPEIWNILVWSVSGANLSQTQIDAAIQRTNWYRTHSQKQQAWHVLAATDPAEAVKRQKQKQNDVLLAGVRMGSKLTLGQIGYIADLALQNGWSDSELQDQLVGYTSKLRPDQRAPGEFGAAITTVRQLADEYAMPLSAKEAETFAARMLQTGTTGATAGADEGSIRDMLAQRAKSLYPALRRELEAGVTVAQWAQPYKQIAAQELGVSVDAMTFSDPRWKAMLEGVTTKDGKDPMTLSEWQTRIRTDAKYGYDKTSGGRLVAAGLADEVSKMFGSG